MVKAWAERWTGAFLRYIIVAMMQTNPKGESKLMPACTLPLPAKNCIKEYYRFGLLRNKRRRFNLIEIAPTVSVDEIKARPW